MQPLPPSPPVPGRKGSLVPVLALGASLLVGAVAAQQPQSPADDLIEQERIRAAVEEALEVSFRPADTGAETVDAFIEAGTRLVELSPDSVPYLVNELDQRLSRTYFLCAYSLGRIGSEGRNEQAREDAVAALRGALKQAVTETGQFAFVRKGWAAYGLALAGRAEAVDLISEGRHKAGHMPMHANATAIEIIALLTAPDSVPLLLAQLDRWSGKEKLEVERSFSLRALGRVRDPSSVPKLVEVLADDPDAVARAEAAMALGRIGTKEAVAGLLQALDDPVPRVRKLVAVALDDVGSPDHLDQVLEHLEHEEDPLTRGFLYRVVARGGPARLDALKGYLDRTDPRERSYLIEALGIIGTRKTLPLLREGLASSDNRVLVQTVIALADLDTEESRGILLDAVGAEGWPLAQTAIEHLVEHEAPGAGPAIADRLLERELAGVVADPVIRDRAQRMLEALVALRFTERLDDLRRARARQRDGSLLAYMDRTLRLLELLARNGEEIAPWVEAAEGDDAEIRLLAYRRLGEIGGAESGRVLVGRFGRVEPDEGVKIVAALGEVDSPESRQLLRRILTSPDFDSVERTRLRDAAAWSAYRLGGSDLRAALEESIDRRHGRDGKVLVYYALLAGDDALPKLAEYRVTRLRYIKWTRGKEQVKLDWISRELAAGRSIDALDVPPERMVFR